MSNPQLHRRIAARLGLPANASTDRILAKLDTADIRRAAPKAATASPASASIRSRIAARFGLAETATDAQILSAADDVLYAKAYPKPAATAAAAAQTDEEALYQRVTR